MDLERVNVKRIAVKRVTFHVRRDVSDMVTIPQGKGKNEPNLKMAEKDTGLVYARISTL